MNETCYTLSNCTMLNDTFCNHGNTTINCTTQASNEKADCLLPSIIYAIIGSIGVLDNALVLFVMFSYKRMMKEHNNFYIINQSIIDMFASLFLLATLHDCGNTTVLEGISGELYCRLWRNKLFLWGCLLSSTYNIVGLTMDRYAGDIITRTSKLVITLWRPCELFLCRDNSLDLWIHEISLPKTIHVIFTDDHHERFLGFVPYYYWFDIDFNDLCTQFYRVC